MDKYRKSIIASKDVNICEWLIRDLGKNFALDIRDNDVNIVIVQGEKKTIIQFAYFKTKLQNLLTNELIPFLKEYYKRYSSKYDLSRGYDPVMIATKIFKSLIEDTKSKDKDFESYIKDLLVNIAGIPVYDASELSMKLAERYKKLFGFE